jgi:predicted nucleic acid-binding protein
MVILVDSNVLLRAVTRPHADYSLILSVLTSLRDQGHRLAMVPQGAYEYYVVATRPVDQNGLGLTSAGAIQDLDELLDLFTLLRDERSVFTCWRRLIEEYSVHGKTAHDARVVAAMLRHGIAYLLTFNVSDFTRYRDRITILDPHRASADPHKANLLEILVRPKEHD